jgi:hypothetical protein
MNLAAVVWVGGEMAERTGRGWRRDAELRRIQAQHCRQPSHRHLVHSSSLHSSEPVFVNVYGAQESIPGLLKRFTNKDSVHNHLQIREH